MIKEISNYLKKFDVNYDVPIKNIILEQLFEFVIKKYSNEEKLKIIDLFMKYILHLLKRFMPQESIDSLYKSRKTFINLYGRIYFRINTFFHDVSHEILHSGISYYFYGYDYLPKEKQKNYYNIYHDYMESIIQDGYERMQDIASAKTISMKILYGILHMSRTNEPYKLFTNLFFEKKDLKKPETLNAREFYINFKDIKNKILWFAGDQRRKDFVRLNNLLNYFESKMLDSKFLRKLEKIVAVSFKDISMARLILTKLFSDEIKFYTLITQEQAERFLQLSLLREKLKNDMFKIVSKIVKILGLDISLLRHPSEYNNTILG